MVTVTLVTSDGHSRHYPHSMGVRSVGGPVWSAWREGTLTRAKELESLCARILRSHPPDKLNECTDPAQAVEHHLHAARQAAKPKKWFQILGKGSRIERAMSNLDAAEAQLLNFAPPDYLLGLMPSMLNHVRRHLVADDPRRQEFERVAKKLRMKDADHPCPPQNSKEQELHDKRHEVEIERGKIVTAWRGASSEALREQLRVRSFRSVLIATTSLMTILAGVVAIVGWVRPTMIPLCFEPEKSGRTVLVCPTAQEPLPPAQSGPAASDVDDAVERTAKRSDLLLVELVGLAAASVAAAAAIRGIRGSSEPYGLPVALALLKLPMGAITAFLGLLLMRGEFVPGLSALDTPAQILAWALVFGYAQQLFTRLVDQQAHTVLDTVRGADKDPQPGPCPRKSQRSRQ